MSNNESLSERLRQIAANCSCARATGDGNHIEYNDKETLLTASERIAELEALVDKDVETVARGCNELLRYRAERIEELEAERDALKDQLKRLQEKAWGPDNVDVE